MKRALLGLLLMVGSTYGVSQEVRHYPLISLEQQLRMNRLHLRWYLAPAIAYQLGKYRLETAPMLLWQEFPYAGKKHPQFSGWQLAACYWPGSGIRSPFQGFFGLRTSFEQFREVWQANTWNVQASAYRTFSMGSQEKLWNCSLYGGLSWQIAQAFSLYFSGSAGYFHSRLENIADTAGPIMQDYRPYRNKGGSVGATIGLAWSWESGRFR